MDEETYIKTKLKKIIFNYKNIISKETYDLIEEFIEHDEWGLAYDTFCYYLSEYDIPISKSIFQEISELGKLMNMEEKVWLQLKELVN